MDNSSSTPNPTQLGILVGLQSGRLDGIRKHVYAGTVTAATKAKRRAADKVAKASRKANRR